MSAYHATRWLVCRYCGCVVQEGSPEGPRTATACLACWEREALGFAGDDEERGGQ